MLSGGILGEIVAKTVDERFDSKWHEDETGCWLWDAGASNGYGSFWVGYDRGRVPAHRYMYERFKGSIAEGLVIDHLCKVTKCINPDHLEAVTQKENVSRGDWGPVRWRTATHCDAGHEFTEENTRTRNDSGWKICRACDKRRAAEARARNRDSINARRRQRYHEKKAIDD